MRSLPGGFGLVGHWCRDACYFLQWVHGVVKILMAQNWRSLTHPVNEVLRLLSFGERSRYGAVGSQTDMLPDSGSFDLKA